MMNEAKKVYAQTGSGDSLSSVASSSGGDTDSRGAGGRRLDRTSTSSPIGGLKKRDGSFNSTSRTLRLSRASSREEILREFDRVSSPTRGKPEVYYGKSETTCWFEVNVQTSPGDMVVVTGNLLTFGFWDPRNGISLSTHATTYPKWTAVAMVPSGESVTYKYVIIKTDGSFVWESDIENRVFTAEGTDLRLEDGDFNVQKVRALNKDFSETTNRRQRLASIQANLDISPLAKTVCIYIVTYRLPIVTSWDAANKRYKFDWLSFAAEDSGQDKGVIRSTSRHGLYIIENLRALRDRCKVWYVGGLSLDIPKEYRDQVTEDLFNDFQCVPIFLEQEEANQFEDFCHEVLKPVFHFVQPTSNEMCQAYDKRGKDGSKWQLYCSVNLKFVKPVVQHFNDGDFVFAFDLELMMTPTLVGSRARSAQICFFFNTPFPSSEIFRALPVRKEVLRSLLNADVIQFHCFTYARHFLSNCSALLGIEYRPARGGLLMMKYMGHNVHVRACHVGIDAGTVSKRLKEDPVMVQQAEWLKLFDSLGRKVVIVGYDDYEPLSGITLKLRAFKTLLTLFPHYRSKVILVQVAIELHDRRGEVMHEQYIQQVRKLAGEIEGMYPGSIMMLQEKMAFARRTALFSVSDLYCNASMRHGLSLVPFEYVLACSQLAPKDKKGGSLVISELAACSRVIPGTMKVNPSREEDFARAIDKCLVQPVLEKSHWREQQERWCRHNTVQLWAETIIVDMQRIAVSNVMSGGDTLRSSACRVGLTKSTYKEISAHTLKPETVFSAYYRRPNLQRLILIDVDLLIRPKDEMRESVKDALLRALMNLATEENTHVFLLSSERRDLLMRWLGDTQGLENIGLAAEDGYYYKWPGSPANRWDVRAVVEASWKDVCKVMMEQYTERTTGTLIESDKVACITWHYGTAHQDWARMQAKELLNQLRETLVHFPVEVLIGKSFVKVRHRGVEKGALVGHILSHYGKRGALDFILCLGDDQLDHGLFSLLKDFHSSQARSKQTDDEMAAPPSLFACTVGKQPAVATHCIYTLEEAHELICGLALQSKRKVTKGGPGMRAASTMLELSGMATM